MKILIVEDEALAAKRLKKMVEGISSDYEIVAMTDSIETSVEWLNKNTHPELILMDIELADGQSFEIFKQVEVLSAIIFTTAYDEYAIKAFKVNSIDYLLKPINNEDLKKSFEKFQALNSVKSNSTQTTEINQILRALKTKELPIYKTRFLVKQGQKFVSLEISEIAQFYTEDKISFIRTFADQRFVVDYSLDELEELLDPKLFFRANRQYIISPKTLESIHNHFNGKLKVNLKPSVQQEVFISRERAADFKAWLGE